MWVLVLLVAVGAALVTLRAGRGDPGRFALALALVASPAIGFLLPEARPDPLGVPLTTARGAFVGSSACRSCHPSEYATWHDSYHRSMTQVARDGAILAPLGHQTLNVDGQTVELDHRDGRLVVRMPDPGEPARVIEEEAVLTTGSHHYQAYWVKGRRAGELRIVPVVWHIEAERLIPRHDVFLQPPDSADQLVRWNSNCLVCHATAAEPRHDLERDAFDTQVVELGIACEACHGPGGPHSDRYRDPVARFETELGAPPRDIVRPTKLTKQRSTEICGQCHAYAVPRDADAWWTHGYVGSYSAGAALGDSREVVDFAKLDAKPGAVLEAASESLFWRDGTIRVGGRELNGLVKSACFARGEGERRIGCVDCHQLHGAERNDQLKPEALGGDVCLGCHAGRDAQAHTQHTPGSPGAGCYGCHMPRVSYALYRAQRSHRIDSPSVDVALASGRPPACNLCHVDRTLGWTASQLAQRWGIASDVTRLAPEDTSLALRLALAGDAASRVIVADQLASSDALSAVGGDFQVPVLAQLLDDPYAAVRFVAARGLVDLGALNASAYDFLAPSAVRQKAREGVIVRWNERRHADRPELLHPAGVFDSVRARALTAGRDDRPITIAE